MALIRKKTGNFLEDFRLGQLFRHKGGRTVTEGLTAHFTDFSFTANPLHRNLRYAQRYGYEAMPIPPGLVMAVAFSQTVEDISENARANLEYIDMRFGATVYVGDTIETETTVLGVKSSSSRPELGVVHVQSIARKQTGQIVLAYQRKVQVFRNDANAKLDEGEVPAAPVDVALELPAYDPNAGYAELAHLSNADTYFEDFRPGDTIEHSRGRVVTDEHIFLTGMLDNTSQVHCNQTMIDRDPSRYLGGKLVVYGGIPFTLCLGLSSPDISDNSLGDVVYRTGRHTAPIFSGDTVFASTEIRGKSDLPARPDLGRLEVTLRGHKFERSGGGDEKRVAIFELERELTVKRRSHYAKS
ncbi:MAG TPA: MaoC family dehydratase [Myxococcota bacterium]|nr:MaoC family dehydratase [Myxococcota bacterium]